MDNIEKLLGWVEEVEQGEFLPLDLPLGKLPQDFRDFIEAGAYYSTEQKTLMKTIQKMRCTLFCPLSNWFVPLKAELDKIDKRLKNQMSFDLWGSGGRWHGRGLGGVPVPELIEYVKGLCSGSIPITYQDWGNG